MNYIEKKLNKHKGLITLIVTSSCILAIAVTYIAFITPIQVRAYDMTLTSIYVPRIAKSEAIEQDIEALKGTPMEEAISYILEASEYFDVPVDLYVGIANAESSFRNFPDNSYNPFGIKPSNQLKRYSSWKHSIDGFSQLVRYYYLDEGLDTCKKIERKYVGYFSEAWVKNCQKYYR